VCVVLLGGSQPAQGQTIITEIIKPGFLRPGVIVADGVGNVYIAGVKSDNVFKITCSSCESVFSVG